MEFRNDNYCCWSWIVVDSVCLVVGDGGDDVVAIGIVRFNDDGVSIMLKLLIYLLLVFSLLLVLLVLIGTF